MEPLERLRSTNQQIAEFLTSLHSPGGAEPEFDNSQVVELSAELDKAGQLLESLQTAGDASIGIELRRYRVNLERLRDVLSEVERFLKARRTTLCERRKHLTGVAQLFSDQDCFR